MKKFLITLFLCLIFCKSGLAESYYFKECKLTDILYGNYLIDFDNNTIKVSLQSDDGNYQEFEDEIELIEKDQIISKKIQSGTGEDYYFVYSLDSKSESIIKQGYKKDANEIFWPDGPKKQSFCAKVKTDWNVGKIEKAEIDKEQKQILKAQEKISKEQKSMPKCQGDDYKQWTNCKGVQYTKDGHKYIGQFKDGKILKGTALYPGGAKYIGEFKDQKPHGQGTFTFSNGTQYFGEWKNGVAEGQGIKTWNNGNKYTGKFKADKPHGSGTFIYSDGSKYVGKFKDGKEHGQGTYTYSDGRAYIGQFVAGLEHGQGTCINQDGSSVECKILKMKNKDSSVGKNRREISFKAKKWIKLSEYESTSGKGKKIIEKLKIKFNQRALELCSSSKNFDVLEERIEILELDETPAIGIETVVKLGIDGVVECK